MKKYMSMMPILFLGATLISFAVYPTSIQILAVTSLLLSLALSTYTIFDKHKGTENAPAKILQDVGVMVLTLIVVIFLGGIAAMLASAQVRVRWGAMAGLMSALGASFGVGYLVRKGMMKFAR